MMKWTFNYTGTVQKILLRPGIYRIEAWGGQGGNSGRTGGYGGYAQGIYTCYIPTVLYIGVGGAGNGGSGGWNGGGTRGTGYGGGGGGATHIAYGVNRGTLSEYVTNKQYILMVAGGGGGASGAYYNGAAGGGGNLNGDNSTGRGIVTGGTLTGPGSPGENNGTAAGFGYGGSNYAGWASGGAGGGGGYYGGGAGGNDYPRWNDNDDQSGAGGSGYINLKYFRNTSGQNGVNSGHGKVIISLITFSDSQLNSNIYQDVTFDDIFDYNNFINSLEV